MSLQQHLPTSVSEGGEVEVSDGNEPDDRKRCPLPNAIQHKKSIHVQSISNKFAIGYIIISF